MWILPTDCPPCKADCQVSHACWVDAAFSFLLCISQGYCCWPFCLVSLSYSPFSSLSDELQALLSNRSNLYGVWITFTKEARHALDGSAVPGWSSRMACVTLVIALVLKLVAITNTSLRSSVLTICSLVPTLWRERRQGEGREEDVSSIWGLWSHHKSWRKGSSSSGRSTWNSSHSEPTLPFQAHIPPCISFVLSCLVSLPQLIYTNVQAWKDDDQAL